MHRPSKGSQGWIQDFFFLKREKKGAGALFHNFLRGAKNFTLKELKGKLAHNLNDDSFLGN